ncbi:hypothetical protein CBR_g60000 [Chara braunii]|uniref:CCHC-type domain-containing protein n=1 Tax=Chara braunii TaxID=69332 RepID=A0A388K8K4_CHABU|nr:hypothetical protein CBR_g60000 [Chara braunii]|eukprot:GBG66349.1 hypothetical protein CBR_g60000 [Chara braunii]
MADQQRVRDLETGTAVHDVGGVEHSVPTVPHAGVADAVIPDTPAPETLLQGDVDSGSYIGGELGASEYGDPTVSDVILGLCAAGSLQPGDPATPEAVPMDGDSGELDGGRRPDAEGDDGAGDADRLAPVHSTGRGRSSHGPIGGDACGLVQGDAHVDDAGGSMSWVLVLRHPSPVAHEDASHPTEGRGGVDEEGEGGTAHDRPDPVRADMEEGQITLGLLDLNALHRAAVEDPIITRPGGSVGVIVRSPPLYTPLSPLYSGSRASLECEQQRSESIRAAALGARTTRIPPVTPPPQTTVRGSPTTVTGRERERGHMSSSSSPCLDTQQSLHRPWSTVRRVDDGVRGDFAANQARLREEQRPAPSLRTAYHILGMPRYGARRNLLLGSRIAAPALYTSGEDGVSVPGGERSHTSINEIESRIARDEARLRELHDTLDRERARIMADGGQGGAPNRNCYNCSLLGHFARWCPFPRNNGYGGAPRNDGYAQGNGGGQRNDGYVQGRPILPPPLPPLQPLQQAPALQASSSNVQPPILQGPAPASAVSNAIIPYQPPRFNGGNAPRVWNNRPQQPSEGEAMQILREMWNDRRKERERRREEDDRRMREEQARQAREEEKKRLEEEEKREADHEAKLARIFREQMEAMEANKKKDGTFDTSKTNWEKIDPAAQEGEAKKMGEGSENKKRDQGAMAGNGNSSLQQGSGRPRVENGTTPLNTGLLRMDIDGVRKAQEAQSCMFQQMLGCLEAIKQQEAVLAANEISPQFQAQGVPPFPNVNPPAAASSAPAPPIYHPPPVPPPPIPASQPTASQPSASQPPPPPPPANPPSAHGSPVPTTTPSNPPPPAPTRRTAATKPGPSRVRMDHSETPSSRFSAWLARMFAYVAGNGGKRRTSGVTIRDEPPQQEMGFDRINRGKKAVVAGPGKEGRRKYIKELTKVLFGKTKHELEELCKKDKIKYVNKKITSAALACLRAVEAYGEYEDEEEEEDSEEDVQEENPS